MAKMSFQRLKLDKTPIGKAVEVCYNPTEFGLSKGAQFAEVAIPGLDSPLLQFVRGDSERLSLELFFDSTDKGTGPGATSVVPDVDNFYRLVKIDGDLHAPPICRLTWGKNFPGITTDKSEQPIPAFDCVVESVNRQFTLFNVEGVPLRATVTLALREYKTLEEQLTALNLRSPDHTRYHVVVEGETLPQIAFDAYQDPNRWRFIAEHNRILRPRQLPPGTVLELPPRL